jgi:excisionase family DNA binding protein
MLTIDEIAERWCVNRKTVYEMVERGEIIALRVGRLIRVSRSHIESLESGAGRTHVRRAT